MLLCPGSRWCAMKRRGATKRRDTLRRWDGKQPAPKSTVDIALGETLKSATGQEKYQHIHGEMRLEIGGRNVPYMGYLGPKDVCINGWVRVLRDVMKAFGRDETVFTFDEGEQGQPAYRFEREGEMAYLSIVDSPLSEASGDKKFQRVPFVWRDLEAALNNFRDALLGRLGKLAPSQVEHWARIFKS
jgi:hypothetical protein